MLKELRIKNYALIKNLHIHPDDKMNVITGETGAGKSIILGALGLLLGNRADTKALHDESEKCLIEGMFITGSKNIESLFEEFDLDFDDECIIRREISSKGKSRSFINDTPVTLDTLKKITSLLVDIHSQHDNLQLGKSDYHLQIIDDFSSNHHLKDKYYQKYISYKNFKAELDQLESEEAELKKEYDYNVFLLEELDKIPLEDIDPDELEEEQANLQNAEEIKTIASQVLNSYSEGEFSISSALFDIKSNLKKLSSLSTSFNALTERIESAIIELDDIINEVDELQDSIGLDEERLVEVQELLGELFRLQQKHQANSTSDLKALKETLEKKINQVENFADQIEGLKGKVNEAEKEAWEMAKELSRVRTNSFESFQNNLEALLHNLGMPNASIKIDHETSELSQQGIDHLNILFSANKGIEPGLISKVASGGEFSRLMFAIKYMLAKKVELPTIIFDEIDTGISGEVAIKMASMMKEMSEEHQVLAISHLPQFAAVGNSHYFVFKEHDSILSETNIKKLEDSERIENIAQMISGENVTEGSLKSAEELLKQGN
ncbi:MAG: DNA repair protein RecN [Bacteroidota bacterium]